MENRLQNETVAAAEHAIDALGRGDPAGARMAIAVAVEIDRTGIVARLADAVFLAASELESDSEISDGTWNQLCDAVGPGPLMALVERVRG